MDFDILQEVEKRNKLSECLDLLIAKTYSPAPQKRLKRGIVQAHLINTLGLVRNNLLCNIITERMRAAGFEPIANQGVFYYRHREYKYKKV